MTYRLWMTRRAQKGLDRVPREVYARMLRAIHALAEDPRPPDCIKMKEAKGWRIRIGDYRVVYDIEDAAQTVTILRAGHWGEVYR